MHGFQATPGGPSGAGGPRSSQLAQPHPAAAPAKAAQARIRGPAGIGGIPSCLLSSCLCTFESQNAIPPFGITAKNQTEAINT